MPSAEIAARTTAPTELVIGGETFRLEEHKPVSFARREVDVCFVFDTTFSMVDKIEGLVDCMNALVRDLARLALAWRLTTVPFGDLLVPGDRVVLDQPFVIDVDAAAEQLRTMPHFSGGGNLGESAVEAMLAACAKSYRPRAVKVFVLVTDEPAHGHVEGDRAVHDALTALDAACFTVTPDLDYYRRWAENHGGEWRQVAAAVDTSAILALFASLLTRLVEVADAVHRIGGGSVRAYLERGIEGSTP